MVVGGNSTALHLCGSRLTYIPKPAYEEQRDNSCIEDSYSRRPAYRVRDSATGDLPLPFADGAKKSMYHLYSEPGFLIFVARCCKDAAMMLDETTLVPIL